MDGRIGVGLFNKNDMQVNKNDIQGRDNNNNEEVRSL